MTEAARPDLRRARSATSNRAGSAATTVIPAQWSPTRPDTRSADGALPMARPLAIREPLPADRLRLLFGLRLAAVRPEEVVRLADAAIATHSRLLVGVLNAAKIVNLGKDPFLRSSLLECDLLLADGQSVVWASRVLGRPLPERVAGCDLFFSLLELADREHRRVFLLGARQEVLDRLCATIAQRWPGAVIAGSRNGYFTDEESADVAAQIADSRADMLFLGITSPKKEIFLGNYADSMGVPVLHGVGGSFDVLAGITRRAPKAWQRAGMEWAYRLLQEPRRLWRRYLVTNTTFLGLLLRQRVHQRSAYERSVQSLRGSHDG